MPVVVLLGDGEKWIDPTETDIEISWIKDDSYGALASDGKPFDYSYSFLRVPLKDLIDLWVEHNGLPEVAYNESSSEEPS
jgi:hypothetical protein